MIPIFACGKCRPLSVEFANWAANAATGRNDDGDFFHNIITGIEKCGVCDESAMPYAETFSPTNAPSPEAVAQAARFRGQFDLAFHWIKRWNPAPGLNDADVWAIKAALAAGWPISAGSYHSLLFVGYEDDPALGPDELRRIGLDSRRVVELGGDRARLAREQVVPRHRLPG